MLTTLLPFFIAFTVVIGPALGSYFGLIVVRGNKLFSSKYGERSQCDKCAHQLAWYDLIPLVSFLTLRGKCRYCGEKISFKIFLAEVLGLILFGTLALGIWYNYARDGVARDLFVILVVHGSILAVLLYFSIYDMFTMSVPTVHTRLAAIYAVILNVIFLIIRLINPLLLPGVALGSTGNLIMGVIAGVFIYLVIRLTANKGMGIGDLLIAVIIGLALGWPQTVSAFYVMIISASVFGLAVAAYKHKFYGLKIPLVPFMTFGYIVALGFGPQIFRMLFGFL